MPSAVIVDGYSTGRFLPPAFARLGVPVVHARSTTEFLLGLLPPTLSAYRGDVTCAGPLTAAVAALVPYRPSAVLAGSEPGVPLADALSERLGLATNGSAMSTARRDKHRMIEAVQSAGLRCARQLLADDPDAIAAWAAAEAGPVVVKPVSAASTQGVTICPDADAAARAARRVLGSTDVFGRCNSSVLVQSYLPGTEYVVDSVSADGQRYVSCVWVYEKTITPAGRPVYDRMVVVDPEDRWVADLVSYADDVLAALGVRHGPAHAEIMMTPDGPALVEIGARLNGAILPDVDDLVVDINQADATALAYARPAEFGRRYGGRIYRRRRHAAVHFARTQLRGVVESVDEAVVDRLRSLPTVKQVEVRLAPGDSIEPTIDLLTSPLRSYMAGDSPAALEADRRAVDELADLIYRVAPA